MTRFEDLIRHIERELLALVEEDGVLHISFMDDFSTCEGSARPLVSGYSTLSKGA